MATVSPALEALEWPRFLELAALEARSLPARALISDLLVPTRWAPDLETSRLLQQETLEMLPLIDRDGLWGPLLELADPSPVLDRLARGAVLEIAELGLIRKWLYAVDSWSQLPREELRAERFKRALSMLPDPFEPLRILDRVLTPEGELSERASPKLAALHAEIRTLKREIGNTLEQLLKSFSARGVVQENYTDVRDGRYVLPIKISAQSEVEGTIYEASASRQTVFIEPREVAPLNNRLRQRQIDLLQEVYIVLADTSEKIRSYGPEVGASALILVHWDAAQARARLGRHYAGKPIIVTEMRDGQKRERGAGHVEEDYGGFRLQQTAHPLLYWSLPPASIIRNDIEFGSPTRTLLITGPNTGGKTVLLKTLGMAGICARTGFPFPAIDQPTVPFFDSFFADLGDAQSIEQHQSSFSGHIVRFKEVLAQATSKSLVLLDELNTATDPDEGAALGRAFLEKVMARGAVVVSTTHDPHLKALAVSDQRILNASMAFDETARTPTYRIVLGVAGRSRALETAARLGMPADVLELARSYLSKEHLEFERVLAKLEEDTAGAARAHREAQNSLEEAERLKKEWTARTEASVNEMLERTRQRLRRVLEQAQDEVRASVQKLDEMKNRRELDQTRSQLNEAFTTAASRVESALHEEAPQIAQQINARQAERAVEIERAGMNVGDHVRIPKWKNTGEILEMKGSKVKVAMGALQITLSTSDIEPLSGPELKAVREAKARNAGAAKGGKQRASWLDVPLVGEKLDLRGKRLDEAMSELEAYLDQAFRGGRVEVTIVHGLGTGAIREGTREVLKRLPYVKTYGDSGNAGATLVEFEKD